MDSLSSIRLNVKKLMAEKGWSQHKLAARAKVGQKTISNLLSDNGTIKTPSFSTIDAIADAFEITAAELISGQKPENESVPLSTKSLSELPNLIKNFLNADAEGQSTILRVARNEAMSSSSEFNQLL